jgi:hypothetical protein
MNVNIFFRKLFRFRQPIVKIDSIFSRSGDTHAIVSGLSIDPRHGNGLKAIESGLVRAKSNNEFIHLYGHNISTQKDPFSITSEYLSKLFTLIQSHNLPILSYEQWRITKQKSGVVLSFDDNFIDSWHSNLGVFSNFKASSTFFVCKPQQLTNRQIQKLKTIQNQGHEIGCHGAMHIKAADYIKRNSLLGYIGTEIEPSIRHLKDAGFSCQSFSYPFGSHTDETDRVLPKYFSTIRCSSYSL